MRSSPDLLVAVFALIWVLTFVAFLTYASVRRATRVMKHYAAAFQLLRDLAYRDLPEGVRQALRGVSISSVQECVLVAPTFSTGRAYTRLLVGASAVLLLMQALCVAYIWAASQPLAARLSISFMFALTQVWLVPALRDVRRVRLEERTLATTS